MLSKRSAKSLIAAVHDLSVAPTKFTFRSTSSAQLIAACHYARRCYATQRQTTGNASRQHKTLKRQHDVKRPSDNDLVRLAQNAEALQQLRDGIDAADINAVITSYDKVRGEDLLNSRDALGIARTLHLAILNSKERKRRLPPSRLSTFAATVVRDFKNGSLPSSTTANAILFDFFRLSGGFGAGLAYWDWLSEHGTDESVDPNVYAAVIELLARSGSFPNDGANAESVYTECIKRFPGAFLEYHLSNNAILPAYNETMPVQAVPRNLLKAIAAARLLRRQTREAYLALDTSLRLIPTEISAKDLEDFIRERPLEEAYRMFLLACKSNKETRADLLNDVLVKFRNMAECGAMPQIDHYLISIRAALMALYSYHASGQEFSQRNLTEIVLVVLAILKDDFLNLNANPLIADKIQAIAGKLMHIFKESEIVPSVVAARTLVRSVRNRGQPMGEITKTMLLAAQVAAGESSGDLDRDARDAMELAGWLGDKELLRIAWNDLSDRGRTNQRSIRTGELKVLAIAALQCNDVESYRDEVARLPYVADPTRIWAMAERTVSGQAINPTDDEIFTDVGDALGQVEADLKILEHVMISGDVRPEHVHCLPQHLVKSPATADSTKSGVRSLYRSITSEGKHDRPLPSTEDKTTSSPPEPYAMGLPVSETRFRNWYLISELMVKAEQNDSTLLTEIQTALRARKKVPSSDLVWSKKQAKELQGHQSIGLSDVFRLEDTKVVVKEDFSMSGPSATVEDIKAVRRLENQVV